MTSWAVVVPVKPLRRAKTRLAPLPAAVREALALAMALDTVAAAAGTPRVRLVVAVSDDEVAGRALRAAGAQVVPDRPDAGLNPALAYGAQRALRLCPGAGVATLSADLPALRPEHLDEALGLAAEHARAVVPDTGGTGTTLLTARPGVALVPAYGPGSWRRHRDSGAAALGVEHLAGLRRDVDTLADLREACHLGVGPHTASVLGEQDWAPG